MMMHWWHRQRIDHYFGGHLTARDEARLRADLGRCAACRARYRRYLVVEAALPGGEARALDRLWHGILLAGGKPRLADGTGWASTPASAQSFLAWFRRPRGNLALAGALASLLIMVIAGRDALIRRRPAVGEPVARGELPATPRTPALHVFRSISDRAAEPIGAGPIHARDGLLFAYTNPDPGFTHLMVFAIDAGYAVHWYYPAYQRAGENPEAVPILPGTTGTELGEEIRHALRPGPVRIYALFLREPHHVLEIETMIRQVIEGPRRPSTDATPLPLPGSAQPSILLEVER